MSSTLFLPSTESQTWKRLRKGAGLIAPIGEREGKRGKERGREKILQYMYCVLGNVISTEIHVWKKNLYVISTYLQLENSIHNHYSGKR